MLPFATPFRIARLALAACVASLAFPARLPAADLVPAAVSTEFDREIRPLLQRHCLDCHSTAKHKGDLDLERFGNAKEAAKEPKVWSNAAEQLANREMPPKDHAQPTEAERTRLSAWISELLNAIAIAQAGDPGPVVLRRLSNAEYTYTVRELTGIESLDPAREFPVDGASGEGFMNVGHGLVMSSSLLTKYLDAAKGIAAHAVLLPDGIRFSPAATRRDWTDELIARIKALYARHAEPDGKLPFARYFQTLLAQRDALASGTRTFVEVAREQHLNARYLAHLWQVLNTPEPSAVLAPLAAHWRQAGPDTAPALAAEVEGWQKALTRFGNVGHMKPWITATDPVTTRQEIRFKIPVATNATEVTLQLAAHRVIPGAGESVVRWEQPRLVKPGRPDLWLRDVRPVTEDLLARRDYLGASASNYLAVAALAATSGNSTAEKRTSDVLANEHHLDPELLAAWLDYLGIGSSDALRITSYLTNGIPTVANFAFVQGWGSSDTPNLIANSSDMAVRVPGNLKAHGVAVHPSPTLQAVVGWRSPITGTITLESRITHAHPECGNGTAWSLELRRGVTRQRLASGNSAGSKEVKAGPFAHLRIQTGDLVSLLIDPRDGNHACDLTAVDLVITTPAAESSNAPAQTWDLAADVSGEIRAGNPHADRQGHADVWHFYTEPTRGAGGGDFVLPNASLLARWQIAATPEERSILAGQVQELLVRGPDAAAASTNTADAQLYAQLHALSGPLLGGARGSSLKPRSAPVPYTVAKSVTGNAPWGADPARFDTSPPGRPLTPGSLALPAASTLAVRVPADLARDAELVVSATLENSAATSSLAAVQLEIALGDAPPKLREVVTAGTPLLVPEAGPAAAQVKAMFEQFRRDFPAAVYYPPVVPVDEVITLTLFHREDEPFARLLLDPAEAATLERLWDELRYVSRDALTIPDAYAQLLEYASQDSDPKLFAHLRQPITERAEALKRRLVETEPRHLEALLDFATRAYRRPLRPGEADALRKLYQGLRQQDLDHDAAFRLTMARVLVAPSFLYKEESAVAGATPGPVSDWELASRLSYFLWSSPPDTRLRELAAVGRLHDPEVLVREAKRLLGDERVRRLAVEFACQWLHIRDFDSLDEKSERHFPTFLALRSDMYEESIRFFTDLFQHDGSVRGVLDADHTFLNEALAAHYGIPDVKGAEWRRVDGLRGRGRGGILGQATTLAKQSGASRTSPILRGNWISEVLLGDKLPRPPKDVPRLPEDEASTEGLTVRQLVEKHSSDPKCSGCHVRIDPMGFALEGFDAIGRGRTKDLAQRDIDTHAKTMDGVRFEGIDGLRQYLLSQRGDAFLRQFCRKLLGYALGREVQLSDEPLLAEMQSQLREHEYRFQTAVEVVVRSRQFREIRGLEMASEP